MRKIITKQTEGRSSDPYISHEKLDVCRNCAKKILRLEGWGAQGYKRYEIVEE